MVNFMLNAAYQIYIYFSMCIYIFVFTYLKYRKSGEKKSPELVDTLKAFIFLWKTFLS